MFKFLKNFFGSGPAVDLKMLVDRGAIIVDVRSPSEYKSGHIKGSINIPLDQIGSRTAELKKKNKTIITVCRSGNRSGMAKRTISSAGIECYNGGAWDSLARKIS